MAYIVKGYSRNPKNKRKFKTKAEATKFAKSMRRARISEGIKGAPRITISKVLF